MEPSVDFTPLLLVSALAVLVPFVSWRLTGGMLPAVVGEVLVGIIFGRPLLGIIEPNEWLTFLALFGFAYLMFLSGLEINLGAIARRPGDRWWIPGVALRQPLISGLLLLALVAFATWACLTGIERVGLIESEQIPILLFILMATAVGVVVPVLKDRPDLGGLAQPLLVGGFMLEFAAIVGVGVVAALEREGIGWRFFLLLAIPSALAALLWAANYGGGRFPVLPRTMHELAQTSSQLKIRAALALLVMFVALSQVVGVELVLGAFMAGLAATVISPRHGSILRVKLDALGYGFFVPIFFIYSGATLDLGAVFDSWDHFLLAPLLLLIAFVAKMAPALLGLAPAFGLRRGLAGGALLSANLSLVLAAGAIAEELHIIDAGQHGALLLMALLTTVIAPPLFAWLAGRPDARARRGAILLFGEGRLADALAERLGEAGRSIIRASAEDPAENMQNAEAAVITDAPSPEQTAQLARALRARDPDLRIIAWSDAQHQQLEALEIEAYSAAEVALWTLESAVLRPGLGGALRDPDSGLAEVIMRNPQLHGEPLRGIALPGGVRILVMLRGGEAIIPDGDTPLYLRDRVTLAGDPEEAAEAGDLLSDPTPGGPLNALRRLSG